MSRRVRGFYQLSRSWYAEANMRDGLDRFSIGVYHIDPDDGTTGEFTLGEVNLGKEKAWRLDVFDDAWRVLHGEFADLIAALATQKKPTRDGLRMMLASLGIEDLTCVTHPAGKKIAAWEKDAIAAGWTPPGSKP